MKINKSILWLIAAVLVVQFLIFKYFYPYASYIHGDSFSYIDAAANNYSINTYLIGYSKFLRLFSVFTKSDFALAVFQYLFIEASALLLLYTIFSYGKTEKITQIILLIIVVVNPLFLYLANLVSSDGLFLGLSFLWLTTLLRIIHKPSQAIFIWHIIILFVAFIFRYNALIYPPISIVVLCFSQMSIREKVFRVSICLLPIALFILSTSYKYKKLTGYWQYSPFSGWQLANNAMYSFRYVDSVDRKPVPERFKNLHKMVCEYFDSTRNASRHPIELIDASTFYMWVPSLTLMKYKEKVFKNDSNAQELKKWASMGPLYKAYGIYIIKQYPNEFIKHFMWPNSKKYFALPVEYLGPYNSGKDSVGEQARQWFEYKTRKVKINMKSNKAHILDSYPIISGILNAVLLCALICYSVLGGWRKKEFINKAIALAICIWLVNAIFTITASSAALRFQSFPLVLTAFFSFIIIEWMIQLMIKYKNLTAKVNKTEFNNPPDISGVTI